MNSPLRIVLLALNLVLLVAAALVLGPVGQRAEAVELRFGAEVGDTHRYEISVRTEAVITTGPGDPGRTVVTDMYQVVRWEVISVDEQAVTIRLTIEQLKLKVDGQEVNPGDIPSEKTISIRADGLVLDTGEVIDLGPWTSSSGAFPALDQMTPLLPDGKVKPGDTWSRSEEIELPDGEGTLRMRADSELLSLRTQGGKKVAEIVTDIEMPIQMSIDFGATLPQVPGDTEQFPKMVMKGAGKFRSTTVHEVETGILLSNSGGGTYEMTLSFEGVEIPGGLPGPSSFKGEVTMDMKRLEG